jgi:hypothetical protein
MPASHGDFLADLGFIGQDMAFQADHGPRRSSPPCLTPPKPCVTRRSARKFAATQAHALTLALQESCARGKIARAAALPWGLASSARRGSSLWYFWVAPCISVDRLH